MRNKICQMKEQFCNFHLKICVVCTLPSWIEAKIESDVYKFKKNIYQFPSWNCWNIFFLKSSPGFLENKDDETS